MEVQQTTKTFKIIKILLITASILATVKILFMPDSTEGIAPGQETAMQLGRKKES